MGRFPSVGQRILGALGPLFRYRRILWGMAIRDLRSRYIGSAFGFLWNIFHPLSQFLLYWFVFSLVLKVRPGGNFGSLPFAPWLMAGLLPWMLFSEVVARAPEAVFEHVALVKKTVFPSEIISVSHLLVAVVNHFITLVLLFVFLLIFWQSPSRRLFFVLPFLFSLGFFSLGLSWFISSLNVFMRDIGQVLRVLLQIWFYVTPIIYSIDLVPGALRKWFALNPIYFAVEGYRMALLGNEIPSFQSWVILTGIGALFAFGGWVVFRSLKPQFADVL